VTCDGIQVRGKASWAVLDDSDFRTFFPSSDVVCYRLSRQRILSAISFNPGKGAYELQVYDIPLRVREFIVGYRVRYADGQLSELQTAKSVDSNWFGLTRKAMNRVRIKSIVNPNIRELSRIQIMSIATPLRSS
jgi:hypothetical protein